MEEPLFSASWHRVKDLVPRLRGHARIHRHRYRGNVWFVLQDFSTGKFHRFTPTAYRVIDRMYAQQNLDVIYNPDTAAPVVPKA